MSRERRTPPLGPCPPEGNGNKKFSVSLAQSNRLWRRAPSGPIRVSCGSLTTRTGQELMATARHAPRSGNPRLHPPLPMTVNRGMPCCHGENNVGDGPLYCRHDVRPEGLQMPRSCVDDRRRNLLLICLKAACRVHGCPEAGLRNNMQHRDTVQWRKMNRARAAPSGVPFRPLRRP
jgi:hypothetical protein